MPRCLDAADRTAVVPDELDLQGPKENDANGEHPNRWSLFRFVAPCLSYVTNDWISDTKRLDTDVSGREGQLAFWHFTTDSILGSDCSYRATCITWAPLPDVSGRGACRWHCMYMYVRFGIRGRKKKKRQEK